MPFLNLVQCNTPLVHIKPHETCLINEGASNILGNMEHLNPVFTSRWQIHLFFISSCILHLYPLLIVRSNTCFVGSFNGSVSNSWQHWNKINHNPGKLLTPFRSGFSLVTSRCAVLVQYWSVLTSPPVTFVSSLVGVSKEMLYLTALFFLVACCCCFLSENLFCFFKHETLFDFKSCDDLLEQRKAHLQLCLALIYSRNQLDNQTCLFLLERTHFL